MTDDITDIRDSLKEACPRNDFLVYRYAAPGGTGAFVGHKLLRAKVDNGEWLEIFKLSRSAEPNVTDDEIRMKAFPFIYDTKSETDDEKRRDKLAASLKTAFPNYHVNVFIFHKAWARRGCSKGACAFMNEYGSDVDIVLN